MFARETQICWVILYLRHSAQHGRKNLGAADLCGQYPFLNHLMTLEQVRECLERIARHESFLLSSSPERYTLNGSDPTLKARSDDARSALLPQIVHRLDQVIRSLPLGFFPNTPKQDPGWNLLLDRLFGGRATDLMSQAEALNRLADAGDEAAVQEYFKQAGEFYGWTVTGHVSVQGMPMPAACCRMKLPGLGTLFDMTVYVISAEDHVEPCEKEAALAPERHLGVLFLLDDPQRLAAFHAVGRKVIRLPAGLMLSVAASAHRHKVFRDEILKQADLELLSPYQSQGAVPQSMFYGRFTELTLLRQKKQTSFAVYGPRRIGKTSLVLQLERIVRDETPKEEICTYIDCAVFASAEDAFKTIADRYRFDWDRGRAPLAFVEAARRAKAQQIPDGRFLLILDEIDRLIVQAEDHERFFTTLRALGNEGVVRTIVCGFRDLRALSERLDNPVFNWFQFMELGSLNIDSAKELIRAPLTSLGVSFEPSVESIGASIVGNTGTHPGTIQFFCHEILRELNKTGERTIAREQVDLVAGSSRLEKYVLGGLEHLSEPEKELIRHHTVASEVPLSQIVRNCEGFLSKDEVQRAVESLLEYMILTRDASSPPKYRYAQSMIPVLVRRRGGVL